jgi:hypothetical protein
MRLFIGSLAAFTCIVKTPLVGVSVMILETGQKYLIMTNGMDVISGSNGAGGAMQFLSGKIT